MIKRSLLIAAGVALAFGANAETLSPQEALQRATASETGARKLKSTIQPTLSYTAKTLKGDAAIYVFNTRDNKGFMLVGADDVAMPMLGYTDSGNFDPDNVPPQLQYWLDEYAAEIAHAKEHNIKSSQTGLTFPSDWNEIAPLMKTKWAQGNPYNKYAPQLNSRLCPTGCVATAMAQVMNYWQYPTIGEGKISYASYYSNTNYLPLSMYFDEQEFDWANMLPTYQNVNATEAQINAVAYLMKACGYSVQMQYNASFSGTQSQRIAIALMNNFKYHEGINSEDRLKYTATEWNQLVYDQLKIGPVIYSGNSSLGGHCFVTDGYDGNGYFHFNWGWDGMCDGYYLLSALNPTQQGTGGFYGGYNFDQSIITGVQKPNDVPVIPQEVTMTIDGTVKGSMTGNRLEFQITGAADPALANNSIYSFQPVFGVELTNVKGEGEPIYVEIVTGSRDVFNPGSYLSIATNPTFKLRANLPATLDNGTYKARLVCRPYADQNGWRHMNIAPQNYDYVYVTKSISSWSVENFEVKRFNITSAKIVSPLYYNNPFIIEFEMENPYDMELSQSVVPYLYLNGIEQYSGESWTLTLLPNQKETVRLNCTFQRANNANTPTTSNPIDFTLTVEDLIAGTTYGDFGTVTMRRSSTNASLRSMGMKIENAKSSGLEEGLGMVYDMPKGTPIELSIDLICSGGFIASPLTAVIYEFDPGTKQALGTVYEQEFNDLVYLSSNETTTATTTIPFKEFDSGKMYQLSVFYSKSNTRALLGSLIFAESAGIGGILPGEDGLALVYNGQAINAITNASGVNISVYDLSGKLLRSVNGNELDTQDLNGGVYLVKATDSNGCSAIRKIAK